MTAEQKARDMLTRAGVVGAGNLMAGELVEIANMIADNKSMRGALNVLLLGYKFDDFVEYVNAKKVLQENKTVV
jgi:hypothetical protein